MLESNKIKEIQSAVDEDAKRAIRVKKMIFLDIRAM